MKKKLKKLLKKNLVRNLLFIGVSLVIVFTIIYLTNPNYFSVFGDSIKPSSSISSFGGG